MFFIEFNKDIFVGGIPDDAGIRDKEGKTVADILEDAKKLNTPKEDTPEVLKFVEAFFQRRKEHDEHGAIATNVIERWLRPKNRGAIPDADALAKVTGPCGDTIEIYFRIKNDRIEQARYLTNGCPNSAACASVGAELAEGKTLSEAYDLTHEDIIRSLNGLPNEGQHCAKLAIQTIREAISHYFKKRKKVSSEPNLTP